jgi:YgiT-type zinc finger domain-containing protein
VENSYEARINMNDLMKAPCSECRGRLRRKKISREFEREGVKVKVSGVQAWVCSRCGEIYFEAGGADRFSEAVNSLFALAMVERQHKGIMHARVS